MKKNRDLKTKGVLGEKTFKLLRRIPIEAIEIDSENRVILRLLRHIDKEDAQTLLNAVTKTVKEDRFQLGQNLPKMSPQWLIIYRERLIKEKEGT